MSLELPRCLLADRLSVLLILGCGVALEAALWRHPDLPVGVGLSAAGLLWAWHQWRIRRAPLRAEWAPAGWRLQLADGRWIEVGLGRGSRLLGSSVLLHWRARGCSFRAWLTPVDLPRPVLRSLALRLRVHGSQAAR
jgi:hypothetical protein